MQRPVSYSSWRIVNEGAPNCSPGQLAKVLIPVNNTGFPSAKLPGRAGRFATGLACPALPSGGNGLN